MKSYNKNARIAGVLFLLGFAGGLSAALMEPLIGSGNMPQTFLSHSADVQISAVGIFVMGFACTGIAIALYPVLREQRESMALGAVIFRGMEGILHVLIGIVYLGMLEIARQGDAALFPLLQLSSGVIEAIAFCGSLAWGIGAIFYYLIFYRRRLIPRWLALWGLFAMIFSLFATVCGYFVGFGANSALNTVLNVPIALQELVLAGWLIVKGVRGKGAAAEKSGSSPTDF